LGQSSLSQRKFGLAWRRFKRPDDSRATQKRAARGETDKYSTSSLPVDLFYRQTGRLLASFSC
jgi:hypothetical protein